MILNFYGCIVNYSLNIKHFLNFIHYSFYRMSHDFLFLIGFVAQRFHNYMILKILIIF